MRCHIPADELRRLQARDEAIAEAAIQKGEEPPLETSVLGGDVVLEPSRGDGDDLIDDDLLPRGDAAPPA
jgi:hypothetical protein